MMAKTRVLVVDDDPAVLGLVAGALSSEGYEVRAVPNPTQAAELAKMSPYFDLLVSDVDMPDVCGPELARQITQICPTIAIVLMSGKAADQALPKSAWFISKPFLLTNLYSVVEKALDARTVHRQTIPVQGSVRAGMARHPEAREDVRCKAC
jgi:two-component system cell cycle response regulator CpdR